MNVNRDAQHTEYTRGNWVRFGIAGYHAAEWPLSSAFADSPRDAASSLGHFKNPLTVPGARSCLGRGRHVDSTGFKLEARSLREAVMPVVLRQNASSSSATFVDQVLDPQATKRDAFLMPRIFCTALWLRSRSKARPGGTRCATTLRNAEIQCAWHLSSHSEHTGQQMALPPSKRR
jgi:hypothetical protein